IMDAALFIAATMPDVTSLDIGGGYKIAYTSHDTAADMERIMEIFSEKIRAFNTAMNRQLHLEIEPSRSLVAHAGTLLAEVVDRVDTGRAGYTILRVNTGMNDILRPAMYGAQHGIDVLNSSTDHQEYVVVGHNCETGDILTPAPHDPEHVQPRRLRKAAI